MEPEESVYQLVNSLCYNLLKEIDCENNCDAAIKLCRSKAFEILLKKSATVATTTDNNFDVEKELEYCIYEMRMKAKSYTEKMKCEKFEKIVEEMMHDQDFQTSNVQATLEFLLHLQNTSHITLKETTVAPFQYQYPWSGWTHNSITILGSSLFCIPRDIDNMLNQKHPIIKNNPYVSAYYRRSISYRGKPDYEKSMDSIFSSYTNINSLNAKESMSSLSPRNELLMSNLVNGTSSCFMESITSRPLVIANSFNKLKPLQHKINHTKIVSVVKSHKLNELHSVGSRYCWENLGNLNIRHESLFTTENPNAFYHLLAVYNKKSNFQNYEPKIVPLKEFMHDIKMLIVGIRSESFLYNDLYIFDIYPNLTINNLSIASLKNTIKEFLECGTCYKRLQILTSKNSENFKLIFDGFVFRALCSGVAKFLVLFRKIVLSCDDSSLLQLSSRIGRIRQQLITLSHILGVHPHIDYDKKIPTGSDFLGYLYKEIINVTQRDMIMLLIFILKECCHVYFTNFQKWIFYGHLDDPYKELFIYFIDHYRINTKYYFDKAFVIRKQSVPDFLQGFEEDILLCGKYTMLLRTFKPTHPIFSLAPPNITVCLSFQQIEKLKSECAEYTRRAQELCGPAVSVSIVYKEKAERREAFLKLVKERERENMEQWREEQLTLAAEVTEEKHRRLENLKQQMQNVKAQRLAERKANIEQEKLYLQHEMEIEDRRLEHEIQEREKRILYYMELNKIASDRKDRAEEELKRQKQEELDILDGQQGAIESEFESCTENDEEEDTSLYEELEKAPCESSVMAMSLGSECLITPEDGRSSMTSNDPSTTQNENYIRDQMNDPSSPYIGMKKSVSDYFNANDVDVELKRNKLKILGSDISDFFAIDNAQKQSSTENLTEAQRNKIKSMGHIIDYDNYNSENLKISVSNESNLIKIQKRVQINDDNSKTKEVLTDLQKNRLKVMKHEFGYNLPEELTKKDSTEDCFDGKELTDLQRIRKKVLSCEFNIKQEEQENIVQNQRSHLCLDFVSTERARNRRKVLESEFNIITGERAGSEESLITTPMSTTSDDIGSGIINLDNKNSEKCESPKSDVDRRFANVTIRKKSKCNLKLDTELATKVNADADDCIPKRCGIPDTAILAKETPASGLNTAGVLHKKGFNFVTDNNNHILTEIELKTDKNYLCKKFSYLQVNDLFYPKKSSTFFPFTTDEQDQHISNKNSTNHQDILNDLLKTNLDDVKYIDGTILKRFIQMSIVIPLNTHMEILNNEILKMYLNDLDILKHFKSLRNYYFLMDGEYGSYICDGIISTLESGVKPSNLLNFQTLHSILDKALGSSIRGNDKNGERLSFIVEQIPEKFDLSSPDVLSVLSLSYKVTWPLNLILNNETLEQYSNIFRYLIKVRRISWLLDEAFQSLKDVVKKTNRLMLLSPQYRHVQLIRHKLLHFVSTLENHITSIALQGSWQKFHNDLLTTKSMEDLYRKHTIYIKRIRFLCMLNKRSIEFNKTIENIFIVILRFCRHLKSKRWHLINGDDLYQHGKYKQMITDELDYDKFIKYTIYLGKKIVKHGYQQEIGDFINLININNFYTTNEMQI